VSSSAAIQSPDPDKNVSTTPMRVRFCETDLMGIVHHGSYLVYFEAGRVEWLRSRGVTYADWAKKGVHLPVVEANVRYLAPARFDDLLTVETRLEQLRTVSMRFTYRILRDGKSLAEGFTRLGCIDAEHELLRIPEEMRAVLLSGELGSGESGLDAPREV
jgi:acyl-CoA thioester hydrolase